jgi:hypothetical protein
VKPRADFRIERRDGRCEWLRTSKLARSLRAALCAAGEGEPGGELDSLELAAEVVSALRAGAEPAVPLHAEQVAAAAARALCARGFLRSAGLYLEFRAARAHRQRALGSCDAGGSLRGAAEWKRPA